MVELADGIQPRKQSGVAWIASVARGPWLPLSRRATMVLTGLLSCGLAVWLWLFEGVWETVVFSTSITLAIGGLIALVTRRALFAAVMMTALIGIINGVSSAKAKTIGMVLHAYDIVFYLGSWSTISYLWFATPGYVVAFIGGLLLTCLIGALSWRADGIRAGRLASAAVTCAAIATATVVGLTKPDRRHTQFYWHHLYVSSFYASWAETLETLWRGQLVEAARASNGAPFAAYARCDLGHKPPHIVLIHQESVVQPGLFRTLDYDRNLDSLFKSDDGRVHKLRVETYGGASWLTEFSILTGLSTHSFGGMRPFVQSLFAGKVRDTLPETLERCGYRNVMFYPMLRNFVSNARFYAAIGLKEIFDLDAQKAPTNQERDRFYYGNALAEMEKHVKSSTKPLFTYIQTMSVHWPYNFVYEPHVKVRGGGPGTDPEMSEYLRRVAMAKMDYEYLIAELKQRFPGERILVMQYGDHQPTATQRLLGENPDTEVEDLKFDPRSPAYITYYAVERLNMDKRPLPAHEVVDVPYLGAILLDQANLPMSEANRERLRLMQVCDGHYHGCTRRSEILSFHRRLIDSRLISAR